MAQKIKALGTSETGKDLYIAAIIVLVAFGSFGLGRLSKEEGSRVVIQDPGALSLQNQALAAAPFPVTSSPTVTTPAAPLKTVPTAAKPVTGAYVASSRGKRYYPVSCNAANNLSEANKIYFATKEEAEKAGYTPSASCPEV